jgi:hypothetical protein
LPLMAMTPFVIALTATFFAAVIAGWLRGGHPERLAAAVLLLTRPVIVNPLVSWRIGDVYLDSTIEDVLWTLFFGWLAFRSDRWWPFAATAAMALVVLVHILTMVTDISWAAAVSARVGLGMLAYLAVLAGVAERWMAGEAPVSRIERDGPPWRRRVGVAP